MAENGNFIDLKACSKKAEVSNCGKAKMEDSDYNAEPNYPPIRIVIMIVLAIYLAAFLVALDRTIIGVAIPKITDQFKSIFDIAWYGSAYL